MSPRTGARPRRLGSIRLSLILLALVPSVTLAAMWGVTTTQMFTEGLRLRSQTQLSRSTGAMGTEATLALQRERSLSAAWLAGDPRGSRAALEAQRKVTDKAVAQLVGQSDAIKMAPARISDRLYSVLGSVGSLEYYRGQVDDPTDITAAQALDQYSSIIDDQIHAFQELSQVDDGDLTSQAGPLVALEHAAELVAQEDAQLTQAWPSGRLTDKSWMTLTQLVDTRRWLVQDQIVPSLQGSAKTQTERILQSPEWQGVQSIEDKVLAARPGADGRVVLPAARDQWAVAFAKVGDEYGRMIRVQTSALLDRSGDKAHSLLVTAASLSAGGLVALLLCVGMSWRITRSLSRRLRGLREATLSLAEERLPDVVARLDRGETVDADLATPPLDYGGDELGQVARAFNKAQRTAVHTAVELADIRRGFQKVILGIARQSQNLVNLQLTKLDTLEREHTDPDVLKGLYELDSTASQLRRYEENLVIISGEQPRRSWREPVALIDILRSAVGEVAEYQRVEVHTDEDVYLAPPAVADVIHLLAELIDNATAYSPAPSPVSVRAALVAKGLVVEVEDRGLGMAEEDYASFNAQLAVEPKFDVVALADDLRLGMFVIARLATRHGIAVTLRPSPYGGTTAIVLLPHDIVVREVPEPARAAGQAWDGVTGPDAPEWHESAVGTSAARTGGDEYAQNGTGPGPRPQTGLLNGTEHARATGTGAAETAGAYGTAGTADTGLHGTGPAGGPYGTAGPADTGAYGTGGVAEAGGAGDAVAADWRAEEAVPTGGRPEEAVPGAGRPEEAVPGAGRPEEAVPAPGRPGRARYPGEERWVSDARHAAAAARGGEAEREAGTGDRAGQPGRHARRPGLAPLPRRVPQTSLVAELLDDGPRGEQQGPFEEFTPEQAASSLGGFQRGTLRARDEGAETQYDQEEAAVTDDTDASSPAPGTSAAGTPADR
ncbi:nitrate- and nitrite sensing domain-containing protein [Streptomyces sp. NPDC006476]|uniref:sensor histidine kinase n=1 Tax=Streptomyces sp. NPDC006476 TaxID=3157175 RepID=UPI0033A943D1